MPENRTPQELVELAKEIRRRVEAAVRQSVEKDAEHGKTPAEPGSVRSGDSAEIEAEALSPGEKTVRTGERIPDADGTRGFPDKVRERMDRLQERAEQLRDKADDYWDLGRPKPRSYEKPAFRGRTLGVTDVNEADPESGAGERIASPEKIVKDGLTWRDPAQFDDLPSGGKPAAGNQGSQGRVIRTAEGYRSVTTGSYRRHTPSRPQHRPADGYAPARKRPAESSEVRTYSPGGMLIRSVSVRTWESDTEFYNRFLSDASRSHASPSSDPDAPMEPVPYTSFVPQYAHMNLNQLNYYRWVRENIRRGVCPPCDFPYLLLYIYEIINLPDLIPPEKGADLLATVWLGYRGAFPRLDGSLCEWMPDYCLIHGVPMPEALSSILPEIVPKAQLKEFWLDRAASDPEGGTLARAILENSSDYDYRKSRYYPDHREEFEKHIPAAIAKALRAEREAGTGLFALDRTYQMTRDSYVGAVAASSVKRRIDLSFVSITRKADSRNAVTAAVKYAENKLRAVLGVKAKLGADGVSEENARQIDAYFAPLLPTREQIRQRREDAYMPPDYLKNYEAEDSGFDPDAAAAIEAKSWANTSRLTGDDYGDGSAAAQSGPDDPWEETVRVEGEIPGTESLKEEWLPKEDPLPPPPEETEPAGEDTAARESREDETGGGDETLRGALRAAMEGRFRGFCRGEGLYEGDAADRINALFLDRIGDIVLEPDADGGFRFIEDYREDAEEWLR